MHNLFVVDYFLLPITTLPTSYFIFVVDSLINSLVALPVGLPITAVLANASFVHAISIVMCSNTQPTSSCGRSTRARPAGEWLHAATKKKPPATKKAAQAPQPSVPRVQAACLGRG